MSAPIRVEIPAEEVVAGDYLPGLEWGAGGYEETGHPGPKVVRVTLTPENRWPGDGSRVVEILTDAGEGAPNRERIYYSGEIVGVWRFEE